MQLDSGEVHLHSARGRRPRAVPRLAGKLGSSFFSGKQGCDCTKNVQVEGASLNPQIIKKKKKKNS